MKCDKFCISVNNIVAICQLPGFDDVLGLGKVLTEQETESRVEGDFCALFATHCQSKSMSQKYT